MSFKSKLNDSLKESKENSEKEKTKESIKIDNTEDQKDEKLHIKKSKKEDITIKLTTQDKDDIKFDKIDWTKPNSERKEHSKFDTIDWTKSSDKPKEKSKFDTIDWTKPAGTIKEIKNVNVENILSPEKTIEKPIKTNPIYKYDINDMQKIAQERGGICLSDEYLGVKKHLKWQCINKHEWEATPDNIINQNSWCPKCNDSNAERTCRQFFEELFNKIFRKSYPDWLKNPKGNKMHLDGYNKELNLAFEYQGSQHYKFSPYFHRNIERFEKDQRLDKLKEELCKKQGIHLIKVPYTVKFEKMEQFIRTKVKNLGIKATLNPNKIDYKKFKFFTESKLEQMQKLAESRGGKLLSKKYINARTKLEWQCEKGHIWSATPNNIKNNARGRNGMKGNWCPECIQRKKYTIEEVKEFAESKGGKCLSDTYKRAHGILKWKCENNHEFKASFFNVKNKSGWCPEC